MHVTQVTENSFGNRIRETRLAWGWSQGDLAESLRVDQASISFWERNKIRPSGSAMVALAALFRTSVEALESGDGFVTPELPKSDTPVLTNHTVSLPVLGGEQIVMVGLEDGSVNGKDISSAMMMFMEAVKKGHKVWIVVE